MWGIYTKLKLDIGGGNIITSIITKESVEEHDIKIGDEVSAIIKSTEVIIGKWHIKLKESNFSHNYHPISYP